MGTQKSLKSRRKLLVVSGYFAVNALLFFANPYASDWHYGTQDPVPMSVMMPKDSRLSVSQIRDVLDAIDLAYRAREPNQFEQAVRLGQQVAQFVFLPSSIALGIKSFMGYMGPANSAQRAFTLSVKQRYNHLARLAVQKGMQEDGFLFVEEASLKKQNGQTFASLRQDGSAGKAK